MNAPTILPRLPTQREIELLQLQSRIDVFRPDGVEAGELIDAFAPSLRAHYGSDNCTEALLYLSLAKNALNRLDQGYQVDARDELEALEAQRRKNDRRMP